MPPSQAVKVWHPSRFTIGSHDFGTHDSPFIVIISNQPIEYKILLLQLCHKALLVVCADGGANRLKDLELDEGEERQCGLKIICGDLDSIRPGVMEYYQAKGVKIIRDPDQDSTDLTKCLKHVRTSEELAAAWKARFGPIVNPQTQRIDVAIFGGLGGRVDQALSQLHHLYLVANQQIELWKGDLFLITAECVVFLLAKGANRIYTPVDHDMLTENVGIIPMGKPSSITTRGLEWDVTDWPTEFGTQISTSNHIREAFIIIECTERVLLTLEFD